MAEEFSLLKDGSSSNLQLISRNEEEVRQGTVALIHAAVSPEALEDEATLRKAVEALARSKEAVRQWDSMLQYAGGGGAADGNCAGTASSSITAAEDVRKKGESGNGSEQQDGEGISIVGGRNYASSSPSPSLSLEAIHFRRKTALREVKAKEEALFRLQTQVNHRQAQRVREAQAEEAAREVKEREEARRIRAEFAARHASRQAALEQSSDSSDYNCHRGEGVGDGGGALPTLHMRRGEAFVQGGRIPLRPLREAVFNAQTPTPTPSVPSAFSLEALRSFSSTSSPSSRPTYTSTHRQAPGSSLEYRGGALLPRVHRVQLRSVKRVRYEDDTSMEAFLARLAKREKLEELQCAQQLEAEALRAGDSTAKSSSSLEAIKQQRKEENEDGDSATPASARCSPSAVEVIDVDALMEVEEDVLEEVLQQRHRVSESREGEQQGPSRSRRGKNMRAQREGVLSTTTTIPSASSTTTSTDLTTSLPKDRPALPPVQLFPIAGNIGIPITVYHRLLDFQQEGVQWLLGLHLRRQGGILGDEMGLGKTVQIAAMLSALSHSHQLRGPVLLVCPVTVIRQWVAELHRWSPRTRVVVLHQLSTTTSTPPSPLAIVEAIRGQPNTVLLTSYAAMRRHCEVLQSAGFHYVILDEGHKISNPAAGTTLAAKAFATPHRLLLTGSPIQNSLKELWCLFDFVCPGVLGTISRFSAEFEEVIGKSKHARASPLVLSEAVEAAKVLQERMTPFLLRRLKRHVNAALPEKYEKVIYVTLTDTQLHEYATFLASPAMQTLIAETSSYQWISGGLNRDFRDYAGCLHVAGRSYHMKDRSKTSQIRLESFRALHRLRQLCNHVDIFQRQNLSDDDDEDEEMNKYGFRDDQSGTFPAAGLGVHRKKNQGQKQYGAPVSLDNGNTRNSRKASQHVSRSYASNYPADLSGSAKLQTLQLMLKEWKEGGTHRALIFSQSRMMLDIIENMVETDGYTYVRMDGTTPIRQRQDLMDRFNADEHIFLALLTTRVGGVGLNLIGADRVIIFDPDWNPTTDAQARERSWRVGQHRDVCVYRLITMGTVEEFIFKRQLAKMYVTDKVLRDPTYQRFFAQESFVEGLLLGECYDARIPEGQKHVLVCRDLTLGIDEKKAKIADEMAADNNGRNHTGLMGIEGGHAAAVQGTSDFLCRSVEDVRGREIVVQYDEYGSGGAQTGTSLPSSPSATDPDSPARSSPTSGEGLSVLQNLVDGASIHDSAHDVARRLAQMQAHQRMQRVRASGAQRGIAEQQEDFKKFLLRTMMDKEAD